jgi:TPP-dependent pyruvate/acetoin dehydrogenase alpha subunit
VTAPPLDPAPLSLPAHAWALGLGAPALCNLDSTMVRIRSFEERVLKDYLGRRIPGFTHLYIGEEACAAGVCAALGPDDYITSTHRGHGHAIAKGLELGPMMAELYGKATGTCRGRGGSMHIADFRVGMLGANGIVGGGFGIAVGAALSSVRRGDGRVAVCFFGDGGINKGTFHEAMNFAGVAHLPVVFVCENNKYAQYTASERLTAVTDLSSRAAAYGMPGVAVDGNDVLAVFDASRTAVGRARAGDGPSLLVLDTYRYQGHSVGDPEVYRSRDEVAKQRRRDPILRFERWLLDNNVIRDAHREERWAAAAAEVEAAVEFAVASPDPEPLTALDDLFTPIGAEVR